MKQLVLAAAGVFFAVPTFASSWSPTDYVFSGVFDDDSYAYFAGRSYSITVTADPDYMSYSGNAVVSAISLEGKDYVWLNGYENDEGEIFIEDIAGYDGGRIQSSTFSMGFTLTNSCTGTEMCFGTTYFDYYRYFGVSISYWFEDGVRKHDLSISFQTPEFVSAFPEITAVENILYSWPDGMVQAYDRDTPTPQTPVVPLPAAAPLLLGALGALAALRRR